MNDTLAAYLAGAIDADGHITITRSDRREGGRYAHRPTYYFARIGYTSIDSTVPELFKASFGGSVWCYTPKAPRKGEPVFVWEVSCKATAAVARELLPHLRVKLRQAQLLIGFEALLSEQAGLGERKHRITPEQQVARAEFWEAVTRLNRPRNRRIHFPESPEPVSPPATP